MSQRKMKPIGVRPKTEDDPAKTALLKRLGRNLRWVREISAPSAAAMARQLGLANENQWTRYETGGRKPDFLELVKFCDLTGCTMDFLWRDKLSSEMAEDLKLRLVALHPELVLEGADIPPAKSVQRVPAGT